MAILFHNVTAVLMDQDRTVLPNAFVAVEGHTIVWVGATRPQGDFDQEIDGKGGILLPGFVNAHSHIPMTTMRGYGDGHNLQDWLNDFIFPVEDRWDPRAIRAATGLGLCEMIASGITCTADMYMFCEDICEVFAQSGVNGHIDRGTTLFGDYDPATHEGTRDTLALIDKWHGYNGGQIRVDACLHGEYTSQEPLQSYLGKLAVERGLNVHVHISETRREHEECLGRWGKTPIQILNDRGLFERPTIAAHCVWTTPEDWAIMAQKGISAVHNPMSNLKLGSGIAPITKMRDAGVNIALGTDGVSSNNCTDFFGDLKLAAILQNGANCDPQAILPWEALEMATINGAKALGRNSGKIAVGCDADLILVDTDAPNMIPCHDPVHNLVYAAHSGNVKLNMCRGKVIYKDGQFLTLDLEAIKKEVKGYALPLLFPEG